MRERRKKRLTPMNFYIVYFGEKNKTFEQGEIFINSFHKSIHLYNLNIKTFYHILKSRFQSYIR